MEPCTDCAEGTEFWLPVRGFEGLYAVSDMGRVKSLDRVITDVYGHQRRYDGKIRAQHTKDTGHKVLTLRDDGKMRKVHRLMLEAFTPGPPTDTSVVRHWNGIPDANRLANLRWGTVSENISDDKRNGILRRGKLRHEDVAEIRRQRALGVSRAQLAEQYGVSLQTITNANTGTEFHKDVDAPAIGKGRRPTKAQRGVPSWW